MRNAERDTDQKREQEAPAGSRCSAVNYSFVIGDTLALRGLASCVILRAMDTDDLQ